MKRLTLVSVQRFCAREGCVVDACTVVGGWDVRIDATGVIHLWKGYRTIPLMAKDAKAALRRATAFYLSCPRQAEHGVPLDRQTFTVKMLGGAA